MSTEVINNNNLGAVSASPGQNSPPPTGGSNVGAMAAAIFQIAATMTKLNNNNLEVSIDATDFQNDFNKEQRAATIEEGNKQALGSWLEMGSSLFSATVTLGTLGADNLGKAGELQDQLKEQSGQLGELQDFQGKVQDKMTMKSQEIEMQQLDSNGNPIRDPQVDNRIKEMESGKILTSDVANGTSLNDEAINATGNNELTAIKGQTDDQIRNKHSEIEATNGELQRNNNRNRMISEIVNQAGKSGFDAGKSVATEQAAHARSAGQAAQYEEKTMTESGQAALKAIETNQNTANSALSSLAQAGR
ncbi:MAG: hypothetical protein JSR39_02190 [Verrucomicrobia bacterium]|nr:hypothetical protein [Verrucomicrobiota bacterium]